VVGVGWWVLGVGCVGGCRTLANISPMMSSCPCSWQMLPPSPGGCCGASCCGASCCGASFLVYTYGVAAISRLLEMIGLFCKRDLSKRRYSAKETYNFEEPTNHSHPILDL